MDTLPEECIAQVLAFATSSLHSLHALLLTNTTLFRLSAAILYRNPFELLERHVEVMHDRKARQVKVLRLFLACIPETLDTITTASVTSTASLPGLRKPTIDYLALYNCHFEKLLQFLINPALTPSPSLSGLHAHIHLGLVGHTPQHIHTIGYSIHGLSTLLPLVDQLSRLVRLELYKKFDRREISTATDFILAHRRIHQSLQEIKIKTPVTSADMARLRYIQARANGDSSTANARAANDDQFDLSPLIQAMDQPRVIDVTNWADADLFLSQFPLEQCRVLQMRQGLSRSASSLPVDILSRLANAKVLRLVAFHQDMFSWAVRRQCPESTVSTKSTGTFLERGVGLPSITSISLNGLDTHMVPAFVDAVAAFHSTLQTLVGLSRFEKSPNLVLGWNQSLPRLTRLDLEGTIALLFDLTCLSHCTGIRDLRLNIGRKIPKTWVPSLKAQQLAQVSPSLRYLDLAGWWGLSDSCFTETLLPVFRRLWTLNVMSCDGPTVDVLLHLVDRLPSLTWLGIIATLQEHNLVLQQRSLSNPLLEIDVQIKDE